MNHTDYSHYGVMFIIMIVSGLLSTMNVWVDKIEDIRFSLNDLYMTLLMTGWMDGLIDMDGWIDGWIDR